MKKDKTKKNNINIELDESIAQGLYSNLVIVNHSPTEFVLFASFDESILQNAYH